MTAEDIFNLKDVLGRLRSQLLDLTAQNRLLNFRYTSRSIRFTGESLYGPYQTLLKGDSLQLQYVPVPFDEKGSLCLSAQDCAIKLGMSTSYELAYSNICNGRLQTLLYPRDLERVARILHGDNRLAVEESGNHVLYLVSGFLYYTRSEGDGSVGYEAPLLMLPVTLNRGMVDPISGFYTYELKAFDTEETIRDNGTLREKLKQEFNFQLPLYENYQNPMSYLQAVVEACSYRKDWKVLPHLSLALLSFKKIALWADLDIQEDAEIINHPLIKKLFGVDAEGCNNEGSEEEHFIDNHPLADIPFIYDADSSQHSALIDAMEGKNLVIIGPPGTGKSQTITNLIAAAMGNGKTVLFISDKKAALDVVSKRLDKAGLAPFCLELHSNKSCKKMLINNIEQRIHTVFPDAKNVHADLTMLKKIRGQLNGYASLISKNIEVPGQPTVHDIFWKAEKARLALGKAADHLSHLHWPEAIKWTIDDLNRRRDVLESMMIAHATLKYEVASHPLQDMDIELFSPLEKHQMERIFRVGLTTSIEGVKETLQILGDTYAIESMSTANWCTWLQKLTALPSPIEMAALEFMSDDEDIIQKASTKNICNALSLVKKVISSVSEAAIISGSTAGLSLEDLQLTEELDDLAISDLRLIKQDLDVILTCCEDLPAFESLADLQKLADWLRYNQHFMSLSSDRADSISNKLVSLFNNEKTSMLDVFYDINCFDFNELESCLDEAQSLKNQLEIGLKRISKLKTIKAIGLDVLLAFNNVLIERKVSFDLSSSGGIDFFDSLSKLHFIIKEQDDLSNQFHLNILPDTKTFEEQLKQARKEGLFSFIFSEKRKAKKACSNLFRSATLVDLFSKDLDRLLDWCRDRDDFLRESIQKDLFGCYFEKDADQGKLNELLRLFFDANRKDHEFKSLFLSDGFFRNLEKNSEYLESLIKGRDHLNYLLLKIAPYFCYFSELSDLLKSVVSFSTHFKNITECYGRLMQCRQTLGLLGENQIFSVSSSKLKDLCFVARNKIDSVIQRCQILADLSKTPRQIRSAFEAHKRIEALTADLQADQLINTWNLSTDIQSLSKLEKALSWRWELKKCALPEGVERTLLIHPGRLGELIELLNRGDACLKQWQSSIEELKQFGILTGDRSVWLVPEKGLTLEQVIKIEEHCEKTIATLDEIDPWSAYKSYRKDGISLGLSDIIHNLESGVITNKQLIYAFEYIYNRTCAHSVYSKYPELSQMIGTSLKDLKLRFADLDLKIIEMNGKRLSADISRREVPEGRRAAKASDQTELVLLKHEMAKTCRHLPIRQLMKQAGRALQGLKPCFLMSPLAVAQYLPKGALKFDLLIIDEASQMRLPEAFGAILRCNQMVVVGDTKQLPPTSFFDQEISDHESEEDEMGSIEDGVHSILERCAQVFKTPKRLRWHYRSQHESLISFSNLHFYDNNLIVLPTCHSPNDKLGVYYNYLPDAVYIDKKNRHEAEQVIEALVSQLLQSSSDSVGVVALNQTQRDLLKELFDQKLKEMPQLMEIVDQFDKNGQEVFIKNLENVQGDERDIILVSTVYGKGPGSSIIRQNFGPINGVYGGRRLNVLFTRARKRIEIYTSMTPEDIKLTDKSSLGLQTLKNYLQFAQTGRLVPPKSVSGEAESPFEEAIVDLLQRNEYQVCLQLGVRGYRIDIAVYHPERPGEYLAAIECDGATYHSSRSARDRDRIRQQLLEKLGWKGKIYRIWSTDWFTHPLKQSELLLNFLASLRFTQPIDDL